MPVESTDTIRVLQSVGAMNHGGIEHFVMNLYRAIDRDRVQFDFMYRVAEPCVFDEEIAGLGGRIYRCPSPDKHPLHARRYYESFFRVNPEYRVVHEHRSNNSGFYGLLRAARRNHVDTRIVHSHSSAPAHFHGALGNFAEDLTTRLNAPRIGRIATDYIACSDSAADWMFPDGYVDRNKVTIIPNGIDADAFGFDSHKREAVRSAYDIPCDAYVIGHVGRMEPVKNQAFLVGLLPLIRDQLSNAFLLLVGEGSQRPALERQAHRLGLEPFVIFAGMQSDTAPFYSAMDLLCMPSLYEGLPVSCVEAQANGLPLVLSDTISRQADLTGTARFVPLESSTDRWLDAIVCSRIGLDKRVLGAMKVKEAGFDIRSQARWLEDYYIRRHFETRIA